MSKSNGPIVFTVTPEMAKQMKGIKAGETYVAHKATAVYGGTTVSGGSKSSSTKTRTSKQKTSTKKASAKKTATKKASAKKTTRTKATKKVAKKKVKATKRKAVKPEVIISYVKNNEGCNMTDIEGAVKLPQATIRRILNSARADGVIRTEGQRRGLRYFAGATSSVSGGDSQNS